MAKLLIQVTLLLLYLTAGCTYYVSECPNVQAKKSVPTKKKNCPVIKKKTTLLKSCDKSWLTERNRLFTKLLSSYPNCRSGLVGIEHDEIWHKYDMETYGKPFYDLTRAEIKKFEMLGVIGKSAN